MNKNDKIYVAGHNGMVGSALIRNLIQAGYENIIFKSHSDLDLLNQNDVSVFINEQKPDIVFIAAARVGGIHANNTYRGQFLYENLIIQSNLIHASHSKSVKKLLFLGSACIYPKNANQPIKEEALLSDYLEYTNEPYAIAKIAGIKLCENYFKQYGDNFISIMPNNLYGPNDNFDLKTSHVLPALLRKIHEAKYNNKKYVEIWGTGKPMREFLHVDDLADAAIFIMDEIDAEAIYSQGISHINIGSGEELTINELAENLKNIIGFDGKLKFNSNYEDGMTRKLLDISRLKSIGWESTIKLKEGISSTYEWYKKSLNS